jgi:CDP-glycerol glycerophosphotransferase (TagB/SpsB family)
MTTAGGTPRARRSRFAGGTTTTKIRRGLNLLVYYLSGIFPRSQHRVVFGAWHGFRYSDNPRYLYEWVRKERFDLDVVWCGRETARQFVPTGTNARFVRRGSIRSIWNLLRAGTIFVSHGYEDLFPYNLACRANLVYLGHGVAIKNMGVPDTRPAPTNRLAALGRRIRRAAVGYSYFIVSSPTHKEKQLVEYAAQNCRDDNTLMLGQPRCDVFTNAEGRHLAESTRSIYARRHGVVAGKRVVTYMPTFRDRSDGLFSFSDLPAHQTEHLQSILDRHDAVLVQRSHFVDGVLRSKQSHGSARSVVDLSSASEVDSLELLLISDVLITDYSGAYVDYLLLDRPILHFVYDYDEYMGTDRGLYFDLDDIAGGPLLRELTGLLEALDQHLRNPVLGAERRARVRNILLSCEHGESCDAVAERLLPARSR